MNLTKPKIFIFDFDSTIFPGESLDEIIAHSLKADPDHAKKSAEITAICNQGMSGTISMADSLKKRLAMAAPTQDNIASYIELNKNRIAKDMRELLNDLQEAGHNVWVVSGGFEEWIKPLLRGIIPPEQIHANQIIDHNSPMLYENIKCRDKEEIITELIKQNNAEPSDITIIGDGATDYSVFEYGLAKTFMGTFFYAGVHNRSAVYQKANNTQQACFSELSSFIAHITKFTV